MMRLLSYKDNLLTLFVRTGPAFEAPHESQEVASQNPARDESEKTVQVYRKSSHMTIKIIVHL
jgi:hypothetical protein